MPKIPADTPATPPSQKVRPLLWSGPSGEGPMGGVTFSLLNKFLGDRERFRIYACEGIRPIRKFDKKIEFGSMWHVCEEALAANRDWGPALKQYVNELGLKYPLSRGDIEHWGSTVATQFPIYVQFWAQNPDVKSRKPLLQECAFDVWYPLPSGRRVRLRGKIDSVDYIEEEKGVYIQENKTKSEIDEMGLRRQLRYDMQTMIYLTALYSERERMDDSTIRNRLSYVKGSTRTFLPIKGVRYNVIRRPFSGGKGNIVRHKPSKANPLGESAQDYYRRAGSYITAEPETYFARWRTEIGQGEVERFRRETLDPMLMQLCQWYDWIKQCNELGADPFSSYNGIHHRMPFGLYNSLIEQGVTEYDDYIDTGSMINLERGNILFEELYVAA